MFYTPGRRAIELVSLLAILSLIAFLQRIRHALPAWSIAFPRLSLHRQDLSAGNATLGFSTILAISAPPTPSTQWRRHGLLAAANLTGLEIATPEQPAWSEAEIASLTHADMAPGQSPPKRGHALAWLGHLHALRTFLASNGTTALIVEDDVDFDQAIRRQTARLSAAMQRKSALAGPAAPSSAPPVRSRFSFPRRPPRPSPREPYPLPDGWDLLWLGHCGDAWPRHAAAGLPLTYRDDTLLAPRALRGFWHQNFPPETRILHSSNRPVCSFAYAVTRAGAARLLEFALPPPAPVMPAPTEGLGGEKVGLPPNNVLSEQTIELLIETAPIVPLRHIPFPESLPFFNVPNIAKRSRVARPEFMSPAFDLRLGKACESKALHCVTLNPELFHHHRRAGEAWSSIDVVNGEGRVVGQKAGNNELGSEEGFKEGGRGSDGVMVVGEGFGDGEAGTLVGEAAVGGGRKDDGRRRGYTFNLKYSARCNAAAREEARAEGRRMRGLVQCLPGEGDE